MVRMADATMVWSRAARNMPIIRPMRIVTIWRWVSGPLGRSGLVVERDVPVRVSTVSAAMSALMRGLLGSLGRGRGLVGGIARWDEGGNPGLERLEIVAEPSEVCVEGPDILIGPRREQLPEPLAP